MIFHPFSSSHRSHWLVLALIMTTLLLLGAEVAVCSSEPAPDAETTLLPPALLYPIVAAPTLLRLLEEP